MNEPAVRRIIIACDAACDIRRAVEDAAVLAKRRNAALHGVFFEDENLYRLAGLPFGRQMTLSSAVSEDLGVAELENLSSALGAAMQDALAKAAARHGLEWSFGIVRDLPTVAALAGIEGDMVIVEGVARPFSGSWRPRSAWHGLSMDHARTILIRRQRRTGPGTVAVLLTGGGDQQQFLLAGLAVAEAGDDVVVFVQDGDRPDIEAAQQVAAPIATAHRQSVRSQAAPADIAVLLRQIERLKPSLIVLDAGDVDRLGLHDKIARTSYDVLLIR